MNKRKGEGVTEREVLPQPGSMRWRSVTRGAWAARNRDSRSARPAARPPTPRIASRATVVCVVGLRFHQRLRRRLVAVCPPELAQRPGRTSIGQLSEIVRPRRKAQGVERHKVVHRTVLQSDDVLASAGASVRGSVGGQLTAFMLLEGRDSVGAGGQQRARARRQRDWGRWLGHRRHHAVHPRRIPGAGPAHAHHRQSVPKHHARCLRRDVSD